LAARGPVLFAKRTLTPTAVTAVVWVIVTLLTPPEPQDVLVKFYRQVRPHVTGWKPIAQLAAEVPPTRDLGHNLRAWLLGCTMVYAILLGIVKLCSGIIL